MSRGVELLDTLCVLAEEIAQRWRTVVQPQLPEGDPRRATAVEIVKADAFAVSCDWADSDVVFANSTCFNKELFALFEAKCRLLRPGSIVVTTTSSLAHLDADPEAEDFRGPRYEQLESGTLKEDWGNATLYLQRRTAVDADAARWAHLLALPAIAASPPAAAMTPPVPADDGDMEGL